MTKLGSETLPKEPRGLLILLEGLDRAGKTTQCELLRQKLARLNGEQKVRVQKVPDRSTETGQVINAYLGSITTFPDQSIHLLFSANRWELQNSIISSIESGQTVILDRYVPSGISYSLAKNVPGMSLDWCLSPDRGLPRPDLTIFLDIDPQLAKSSLREDFGKERYEVSEFQTTVRSHFKVLLGNGVTKGCLDMGRVVMIDATKSIEQIESEIWEVFELYKDLISEPLASIR
ncbi:thymidylate kinase-domain-containing protein [Lipomyces oligophaga]|uniref:thymidylate kinase-domain-containing protein n=1 Tax=Lipomyces oligophaga TaxID=45792 RepID=UPI0034CEAB9D